MYQVILNKTNSVICRGNIVNEKNVISNIKMDYTLISFDEKYYWFNDSPKYRIEETSNNQIIQYTERDDLNICSWKDYAELYIISKKPVNNVILRIFNKHVRLFSDIDIIREHDINELDSEVKNLVKALNNIEGFQTTGSCSGHNERYMYVDIKIKRLQSLFILCKILASDEMNNSFRLTTATNIFYPDTDDYPILQLQSYSAGKEAYDAANRLADLLKNFAI